MSAPTSRKPVRGARSERAAVASPAAPGKARGRWIATGGALLAAIGAIALWWGRGSPYAVTQTADQNVLLVTIDTLRADALGSYGGRAATPHLDRLAAGGARFSFAHAHAVVTLPSHTSILTGQLPVRARHARQQRLSRQGRDPDARDATQGPGLCDRRLRRRLPPHEAVRPDARLRRLRRPGTRAQRRCVVLDARADRRRGHQERDRLDRPPDHEVLLVGARIRSPLAVQAAGRSRVAVRVATIRR